MPSKESLSGLYPGKTYSPYAQRAFPSNVYWGDTHLHTTLSLDAGMFGNVLNLRHLAHLVGIKVAVPVMTGASSSPETVTVTVWVTLSPLMVVMRARTRGTKRGASRSLSARNAG